ncbi:MAG: signal peptide peptidase SppA [Deltaproteobacteria bacterium]|nr:signal peptide peptidase SppA [Deltaproteobacteria bacterium]MBW2121009.1 signal peptide peptidase SppA [Deltaproteobacteria bacterium]
MRRHPVLLALLVVVVLIGAFVAFVLAFSRLGGRRPAFVLGDKIGIVEIKGVIARSGRIIDQLIAYREDGGVKAVVLRIDSPGGAVGPSQEIYREVIKTRRKKKVVASLGGVAASGGYYIASGADAIVANPGTLTGSIGVIMQFSNVEGLMKLVGLKTYTFKSGRYKDLGSPFREPTPEDQEVVMGVIRSVYDQFVEAVAKGRGMELEKVKKLADGRIFSGRQALEQGLVDYMGNLQDAIDVAAKMSGIRGKPHVIYPRRRRNILDLLFEKTLARLIEQTRSLNYRLYYQASPVSAF